MPIPANYPMMMPIQVIPLHNLSPKNIMHSHQQTYCKSGLCVAETSFIDRENNSSQETILSINEKLNETSKL